MISIQRSGPGEWMARHSGHPHITAWGASREEAGARLNAVLLRHTRQVNL